LWVKLQIVNHSDTLIDLVAKAHSTCDLCQYDTAAYASVAI